MRGRGGAGIVRAEEVMAFREDPRIIGLRGDLQPVTALGIGEIVKHERPCHDLWHGVALGDRLG
jgi:hypothetical protein